MVSPKTASHSWLRMRDLGRSHIPVSPDIRPLSEPDPFLSAGIQTVQGTGCGTTPLSFFAYSPSFLHTRVHQPLGLSVVSEARPKARMKAPSRAGSPLAKVMSNCTEDEAG